MLDLVALAVKTIHCYKTIIAHIRYNYSSTVYAYILGYTYIVSKTCNIPMEFSGWPIQSHTHLHAMNLIWNTQIWTNLPKDTHTTVYPVLLPWEGHCVHILAVKRFYTWESWDLQIRSINKHDGARPHAVWRAGMYCSTCSEVGVLRIIPLCCHTASISLSVHFLLHLLLKNELPKTWLDL